MDQNTAESFPWGRLPQHVQQQILSHVLQPDGIGTPLIVGDARHSAHLGQVAVPILLALGTWTAYLNGVRVLYREVHMDICLNRRSAMSFLTAHRALRPRSMVVKLHMTVDVKRSLPLFDTGYTIRQSRGKLIKTNIPTALRCMKVHGQLSEVGFLIPSLAGTMQAEQQVPEEYLPLAEIQLVNRAVLRLGDRYPTSPSDGVRPDIKQAETVIAPAFLACRAWQSGFLPLFEDGTFQRGVSLGLMLNGQHSGQKGTAQEDHGGTICSQDGASLMRCWIGCTIVELLDETLKPTSWTNPFAFSSQPDNGLDSPMPCVENHWSGGPSPLEDSIVDSIEDAIAASSAKASHRSSGSTSNSKQTEDDRRSKGHSSLSDGLKFSEQVQRRTSHQGLGAGCRFCGNNSPASSSSPMSPTPLESVAVGDATDDTASSSSCPEVEAC